MRLLLLSTAALFLSLCTGCVPGEFFVKLGRVAEVLGDVAGGVGKVSEKLTAVSAKMAAKEGASITDLLLGLGGIGVGGAMTGGSIFGLRNNGRRKNGGTNAN